ncbi:single-stranded DNA-binding protein [Rubellicoccus peritrichatus]|uniref:Single-stranded DNA-binding protein n=1 Tax=Rubellicoccus peritrichatus TaxID=3080537 RepID=A0AAQ3LK17_9BACT|nr:single-stranded DNA-binding protein [Puniceicoccus sp. CR14]WOO43684.1 single-stranded DNA-binding protein [Puniceicoccus sp. CR14]
MASFNKVILMGNLTRDPELRMTPGGMAICKLGIAVNRVFTTKEGEKREEVTFIDCDAFGRQAETLSKYMSKGRSLLIEGRLRLDQWESKEGEKRSKISVVVENFQFTGDRGEGGGSGESSGSAGGSNYESSAPPPRTTGQQRPPEQDIDEDVPF